MKKLIFVFVALFGVILITGCGTRQNTVRFDDNGESNEETMEVEDSETSEDEEEIEESDEVEEEAMDIEEEVKEIEEAMEDLVKNEVKPKGKLAVTSFDGAYLKTDISYHVVKGSIPTGTHSIKVNDYKLSKYIPGQTQWDYIASTRFGTLNNGLNNYVVKTFDSSGDQTGSIIFSIDYEAPMIPNELPGVGASHWLTLLASLMITGLAVIFRRCKWL